MIQGTVSQNLDLVIRLMVSGPAGQTLEIEAMIDTGFDGALTLPPDSIAKLGLSLAGDASITLADGSIVQHDVFFATVSWDGTNRRVFVTAVDSESLIGTQLLNGFELQAQFLINGSLKIRKI